MVLRHPSNDCGDRPGYNSSGIQSLFRQVSLGIGSYECLNRTQYSHKTRHGYGWPPVARECCEYLLTRPVSHHPEHDELCDAVSEYLDTTGEYNSYQRNEDGEVHRNNYALQDWKLPVPKDVDASRDTCKPNSDQSSEPAFVRKSESASSSQALLSQCIAYPWMQTPDCIE